MWCVGGRDGRGLRLCENTEAQPTFKLTRLIYRHSIFLHTGSFRFRERKLPERRPGKQRTERNMPRRAQSIPISKRNQCGGKSHPCWSRQKDKKRERGGAEAHFVHTQTHRLPERLASPRTGRTRRRTLTETSLLESAPGSVCITDSVNSVGCSAHYKGTCCNIQYLQRNPR